jgi:predicted  nucleic acid-binding Zn-ribbon protein
MDEVTKAINHVSALMEDQNAKLDAVLEGMKDLPKSWEFKELRREMEVMRRSDGVIEMAVTDMSKDVKVIKAGVTDNSREVADLKHRVTRLEAT